ncbi:MAG: tungsten ABC transporter substrate-binding protein [Methylibium sp. NZG]|nr:MAG: tungsten ABC transporter substrate-binding protein [Methylibium sp. NZG]
MVFGLKRVVKLKSWCVAAGLLVLAGASAAQDKFIVMASTTSTEQSGLFAHLLPAFKRASGIDVRVVAQGTGQALDMGRRGDADVLFVHDTAAEEKFVADGFGLKRLPVMYNDFVLIGPEADPVGVKGKDVVAALDKLGKLGGASGGTSGGTSRGTSGGPSASFISRGDKSGTHAAELRFWKAAGVDAPAAKVAGRNLDYRECGCGMGPALNMASATNAYLLADRGTWLSFKNRGDLAILVEGDSRLFNPYGVIVVNPARHPHTKTALAQAFADWVVSADGQATIASYRIDGEPLFFPSVAR